MARYARYRSVELVDGPSWWPTVGWTALAAFAQTLAAPLLAVRDATPSLVCAAIVLYALRVGARRGAQLALIGGALEDAFAGTGGGWTIASVLVALAAGGVVKRITGDGAVLPALLAGVGVLLRDLVFWIVMRLEGYPPGFATVHLHASCWRALFTALVVAAYLIVRARVVVDRTRVERG